MQMKASYSRKRDLVDSCVLIEAAISSEGPTFSYTFTGELNGIRATAVIPVR
jgi:hypothetical protein